MEGEDDSVVGLRDVKLVDEPGGEDEGVGDEQAEVEDESGDGDKDEFAGEAEGDEHAQGEALFPVTVTLVRTRVEPLRLMIPPPWLVAELPLMVQTATVRVSP